MDVRIAADLRKHCYWHNSLFIAKRNCNKFHTLCESYTMLSARFVEQWIGANFLSDLNSSFWLTQMDWFRATYICVKLLGGAVHFFAQKLEIEPVQLELIRYGSLCKNRSHPGQVAATDNAEHIATLCNCEYNLIIISRVEIPFITLNVFNQSPIWVISIPKRWQNMLEVTNNMLEQLWKLS